MKHFSPRIKVAITIFASIVVVAFMLFVRGIFTPFILGIIISYVTMPFVKHLERHKVPRVPAILIIYLAVVVTTVFILLFIVPKITIELNKLMDVVPEQASEIQDLIQNVYDQYSRITIPESVREVINETIQRGEILLIGFARRVGDGLLAIFSHLLNIVISPVLAFYITKDLDVLRKSAIKWFPASKRTYILSLISDVDEVLGGFIRGQLFVSFIVAVLSALGLYIIGVQFSISLGIIAGIANIIPYFGPIIGSLPAIAMAFFQSPQTALFTLILFIIIQQLESSIISPKIIGDRVGLHPLFVVFALLSGGYLMGIVGMLLAVPAAAIIKVCLKHSWLKMTEYL